MRADGDDINPILDRHVYGRSGEQCKERSVKGSAAVVYVFMMWLWRFAVTGVCAYAVFWKNASGWWFLAVVVAMGLFTVEESP